MRSKNEKVIAILCADIHLSLNAPIWRSVEPDWFAAMKRPLDELRFLQEKFNCPVICAGDIFDRWNSPPELINFAYDNLPKMYSIPGQHDLPLHKYDDIKKSAYLSLINMDIIQNILPECFVKRGRLVLHGFPFGFPIIPLDKKWEGDKVPAIHIAIIHEYRCMEGKSFSKAPDESYLRMNEKNLIGYDVIVYGDNHKGFITKVNNDSTIFNCGTLLRRKSDEINYKPQVGLLSESGEVESYYLDTSKDKYLEIQNESNTETPLDMKAFIQELEKLDSSSLDFKETIKEYFRKNKVKKSIRDIILQAME